MDARDIRASLETQLQSTTSLWDRLPILIELTRKTTRHDPDYAHTRALEALNIAKGLNDRFWIASGLLAIGITVKRTHRYSEALHYLGQASRIFEGVNQAPLKAEADFYIAHTQIEAGMFTQAMRVLVDLLPVFEELKDPYWIARTWCLLGDTCKSIGDHGRGIKYYQKAISLGRRKGLETAMGGFYQSLADSYYQIEDHQRYRTYMFKSLACHKKSGYRLGQAVVMANIANMYLSRRWYCRAENYVRQCMKVFQDLGCTALEAMNWGRLGAIYAHRDEFGKAVACYKKGFLLARTGEDIVHLSKLYETFGVICIEAGRTASGLQYLKKSLSIISRSGHQLYLYQSHRNLAEAYEEIGDTAQALKHLKEYVRIKEEYVNNRKSLEAGRAEMTGQIRTLAGLLKKERSRTDSLKKNVERKEAELVSLTLGLVRKEETGRTHPRKKKSSDAAGNDSPLSGNWEVFARQFHKIHHSFYGRLVERFPELSLTEIKVCSLIRIGLSSKEIASILCISKRTVDSHRERIHRKLRLSSRELLAHAIQNM